ALFGVVPATVIVTARATLDRRVYGVRPMGAIPTPLVPLVADASSWAAQAQAPPTAGGNDNFRVDARAGRVEPGSDGIPEIVLQAPGPGASPSPADNLGVLALGPGRVDPEAVARILADGVRPADLSVWSGQFALEDEAGALDVAGRAEVDAGVVDGLRSIVGAGRVWPLAGPRVDAGAEAVFPVVDFGAGRVVAAWVDDAGRAVVVVQPTQLVTATALVRAGRPANRWIGKVSLTQ
ncbi:MAG TPA: hypothetical protein VF590_01720, partial [Isosphaeraceae bacterium]